MKRTGSLLLRGLLGFLISWTCFAEELAIPFQGQNYYYRWSQDGQYEFTPAGQEDLQRWQDMLTVNVFNDVTDGEQLAVLANNVLSYYRQQGKVVLTDSLPRTDSREAEHTMVAVLGNKELLESNFCRVMLHQGSAIAIVYSYRIYGEQVGNAMSEWLAAEGATQHQALMALNDIPQPSRLAALVEKE